MAIEIYVVVCLLFVAAALMEYAVIMFRNSPVHPAALKFFGLPKAKVSDNNDSDDSTNVLEKLNNQESESESDISRIHTKDDLDFSRCLDSSSSLSSLSTSTLSYLTPSTNSSSKPSIQLGVLKLGILTKWAIHIKDNFDSKLIDAIAFIIFPIAFFVFNVIYWGYYLGKPINRN